MDYSITQHHVCCRDWFRINPLEMILLGCQGIYCKDEARREVRQTIQSGEKIDLVLEITYIR